MLFSNLALLLTFIITGFCIGGSRAGQTTCSDNSTCSSVEACIDGVCIDPCSLAKSCGKNAECFVLDHFAKCRCKPGFVIGKGGCQPEQPTAGPKACSDNSTCGSEEACIEGVCVNACSLAKTCGENAMCIVINHVPKCKCNPGFVRGEKGCIPKSPAGQTTCSDNSTCSSVEACIDGVCIDPCSLAKSCGKNAECLVLDHFAKCRCKPGFVIGKGGCQPEQPTAGPKACSDNSTCGSEEACIEGVCVNACSLAKTCGENAMCIVINHQPKCKCNPGFVRGEKGCIPKSPAGTKTCSDNSTCGSEEACIEGVCVNACSLVEPCGQNAMCIVINHVPKCKCNPGFVRGEKGCIPKSPAGTKTCSDNSTCGSEEACIEGGCINACSLVEPCGQNAMCIVINHVPKCKCNPGFVRGEKGCIPKSPAGTKTCSDNSTCGSEEACIEGVCVNACSLAEPCRENAMCIVINHQPKCKCNPGFLRGEKGCIPKSPAGTKTCSDNSTCGSEEACIEGGCINACSLVEPCGQNAMCIVINHVPKCKCNPGFVKGEKGCIPKLPAGTKTCSDNSTCGSEETCVQGVCVNGCSLVEPCGQNAKCIIINHVPKCKCNPGFVKGEKGCIPKLPAGSKQCGGNAECGSTEACINGVCGDPCSKDKSCGPDEKCIVLDHKPTCTCKTGFAPDKNGVCKPVAAPIKKEETLIVEDTTNVPTAKGWLKWELWMNDHPLQYAVKGGHEEGGDLYICRAWLQTETGDTDLIPGKIILREGACYISWNGLEFRYTEHFWILTATKVKWVAASYSFVPINLVIGGYTEHENLYVGRAKYKQTLTPGKVWLQHQLMYFPHLGKERSAYKYEILVQE